MQRVKWSFIILCLLIIGGCTSTKPILSNIQQGSQPLNFNGARVAILSFAGAPDYAETGRVVREITTGILMDEYRISLISPSKSDAYLRDNSIALSEYDPEATIKVGRGLGADIVLWGKVNQFTPYRFDRLAPATPTYIDITLYGYRIGQQNIGKVTGRKQGELPATIWSRQPTLEDVTKPLVAEMLSNLN